jgi:hypothetical protein
VTVHGCTVRSPLTGCQVTSSPHDQSSRYSKWLDTFWTSLLHRKITNKNDIEKLQKDLDTLGEWAVENEMKINPGKSKAIRFMRAGVKNPPCYSLGGQKVMEVNSCKYLGIILQSSLNCVDQVNYIVQKAWKALHFVMRVSKKEIRIQKLYTSLVRPIVEYGAACWDPCREGQINV